MGGADVFGTQYSACCPSLRGQRLRSRLRVSHIQNGRILSGFKSLAGEEELAIAAIAMVLALYCNRAASRESEHIPMIRVVSRQQGSMNDIDSYRIRCKRATDHRMVRLVV